MNTLFHPTAWLGAAWGWYAVSRTRRLLRRDAMSARAPRPPRLPGAASEGLVVTLDRLSPTCLERSLVLQQWLAARGDRREIVIGVRRAGDVQAHAWIDGEPHDTYAEIHRIAPPAR